MPGEDVAVGDSVLVNKKYKAVVRFIGTTAFKSGTWYGVELEKEKGKHNGTVYGVTYFVAKPNHGTFVDRDSLTPYDAREEAASTVTDLVRKGLDRRRAEKEAFQRASVVLDADDENKHLVRRQALAETLLSATLNRERPDLSDVDAWERESEASSIEPGYSGPHLTFPLTLEQVVGLMEAFKEGRRLHYKYAMQLLSAYRKYACELPTLVEAEVAPGTRMTVCGDTHGQLKDLYSIYTINGVPSPTNRYLMNGDFVDRGEYSCEVVFTLFAWVLLYPGESRTSRLAACLLNRGNHESHNQNMTQGFMSEVLEKYSGAVVMTPTAAAAAAATVAAGGSVAAVGGVVERGLRMYDSFLLAFDAMPLAHLLRASGGSDKKVFVVHGGLMQQPGVRLAHVASIRRKREIPYGYPAFEDKLYEDLMWSDPRPAKGTSPNTRGAGVYFGPDVTQRFCAGNGVSLVVRSHECVQEGYQFMHEGRLVTVFSASQYCGRDTNKGAVIIFEPDLSHTIQQYVAAALHSTAPALVRPPAPAAVASATGILAVGATRGATAVAPLQVLSGPEMDEHTAGAQAENVRRMIMERVVVHKPDLYFFWANMDEHTSRDGRISRTQWSEGMRTVLNLDLPWMTLAPSLVEIEGDGRVSYARFLDRYTIAVRELDLSWMEGIVERACEKLFSVCHTLEQAYNYFDADGSGAIELEEFKRGLQRMDIGLSPAQLVDLMNAIDSDKDGRIQLTEFVSRFKVVFTRVQQSMTPAPEAASAPSASAGSPSSRAPRPSAFTVAGGIAPQAGTSAGGLPVVDALRSEAVTSGLVIPTPRRGSGGFGSGGSGSGSPTAAGGGTGEVPALDAWTQEALNRVGTAMYAGGFGSNVSAIFATIDSNSDGSLSTEEFARAIRRLKLDFTDAQIRRMFNAVDLNKSGSINYYEFVQCFRVSDTLLSGAGGAAAAAATEASSGGAAASTGSGGGAATSGSSSVGSGGRTWQRGVIERIIATLFEYRLELASAFKLFDSDGDGVITREEFRKGLQALTSLTGSPITDMQADELMRALDRDGNGTIDYAEFVDAFAVVDARGKPTHGTSGTVKVETPPRGAASGTGGSAAASGSGGGGGASAASSSPSAGAGGAAASPPPPRSSFAAGRTPLLTSRPKA